MKKYIIILCSLPLLWWLLPKQASVSENLVSLDELVPALMNEAAVTGLAIAKVQSGKISIIKTYGKANIEKDILVTENTLFNIASISKPIMGIDLLMLVDEGKLELDRDINDYLSFNIDNPKVANEKITVRHLATHSSGIADYYDINSYSINQDTDISLKKHLISLHTVQGDKYENGRHYC
jgi:CubicO group peptidase (beta-lactamase class C family)